jgi:hypothetical protein
MSLLDWLQTWFAGSSHCDEPHHNPATGLPMTGGIDILGNPWGSDLTSERREDELCEMHARNRAAADWQDHTIGSSFDDHHCSRHPQDDWHSTGSSWDDWHDNHRLHDSW